MFSRFGLNWLTDWEFIAGQFLNANGSNHERLE